MQAYNAIGHVPRSDEIKDIVRHLEAKAHRHGKRHKVWPTRVARGDNGLIYIDLCNDAWEAVEIGPSGWRVMTKPPVRFIRSDDAREMARPVRGGSVEEFRRFFPTPNQKLLVSVLVSYLVPDIPYIILYFTGQPGAAKSSAVRFLVQLLDPQKAETPGKSKNEGDLVVAALSRHIVTSDNVSVISNDMSDACCRLATGGWPASLN